MLEFRRPTNNDVLMYFEWANDSEVRSQSFNSDLIELNDHKYWFNSVLNDEDYFMLVFQNNLQEDVGQIRIQKLNNFNAIISISVSSSHRGKGYACEMLEISTNLFLEANGDYKINAYIKTTNLASKFSFEDAGFKLEGVVEFENVNSFHYVKYI